MAPSLASEGSIPELRNPSPDTVYEEDAPPDTGLWRKDVGLAIAHQLDGMAVDNAGKYAILSVLTAIPYTSGPGLAGLRAEGMKDVSAAIARGIVDALSLTEKQRLRAQDQINILVAFGNWAGFLQNVAEIKGIKYDDFIVQLGTSRSTMKDLADGIDTMQMGQGRPGTAGYLAMVDLADKMAADCGFETAKKVYEQVQSKLGPFKDEMYKGLNASYIRATGKSPPHLEQLLGVTSLPLNRGDLNRQIGSQHFFVYRNEYKAAERISNELPAKIAAIDPARQAYAKERARVETLLEQAAADLENCQADLCRNKLDQVEDKYFAFKILPGEPRASKQGCWGWAARKWYYIDKRYVSEQKWNRPGRDDRKVSALYEAGNKALQKCRISEALYYLERIERLRLNFENNADQANSRCMDLGNTRSRENALHSEIQRFVQENICNPEPEPATPPSPGGSRDGGDVAPPYIPDDEVMHGPPVTPPDGDGPTTREPPVEPPESPPPPDDDGDGVANDQDNCPRIYNPHQMDVDGDGKGDLCDDSDKDGVSDAKDNCRTVANPSQRDSDGNGIGDACQDSDMDGVSDRSDNCPEHPNPDQRDSDHDGTGDACEPVQAVENQCVNDNDCPIGFDCISNQCVRPTSTDRQPAAPPTQSPPQNIQRPSGNDALSLFGQRENERNQAVGDRSSDTGAATSGGYSMQDLQNQIQQGQQQLGGHAAGSRPGASSSGGSSSGTTGSTGGGGGAAPTSPSATASTAPSTPAQQSAPSAASTTREKPLYYLFEVNARYKDGSNNCRYQTFQVMSLLPSDVDEYKAKLKDTVRWGLGGRTIESIHVQTQKSSPSKFTAPEGRGAWCYGR